MPLPRLVFTFSMLVQMYVPELSASWREMKGRRLQNWGGTPLRSGLVAEPLPAFLEALSDRLVTARVFGTRRPNHGLINEYDGDQGIMAHKDGPIYFPRVAIVSLHGSTMFEFRRELKSEPLLELLVEPRSLLIFQDAAYHELYHAIPPRFTDTITARTVNAPSLTAAAYERSLRISITLRVVPTVEERQRETESKGES